MRAASAEKDDENAYDHQRRNHRQNRHRCGTGRARRAGEGSREEGRQPKKGAPKGKKGVKRAKTGGDAKKSTKTGNRAAKPERKSTASRAGTKGEKILELIGRAKGATLTEIMKGTDWQAHSVRGFLSTASKKQNVKIESTKTEANERLYKIVK